MQTLRWLNFGALGVALTACGGGGGTLGEIVVPPPAATTAEGAYAGALSGATTHTGFQMVVLDGGEYWVPYGVTSGSTFLLAGFIQGTGSSSNGRFSSSNALDYGVFPVAAGTVSASYVAGTSVQGSVTYATGTVNFTGTTAEIAPYVYGTPASLSQLAGAWSMTALDGSPVAVSMSAAGTFTSNIDGCASTGTVLPRPSGKNVFDVAVTAGASPCAVPGQVGRGIAVYSPIEGSLAHQLLVGLVASDRSAGSAYVGAR